MSTDPTAEDRIEDGHETVARGELDGMDAITPVDAPIAVKVSTPSTVIEGAAQQPVSTSANDYFTAHPAASEQLVQSVITGNTSPSPSVSASDVTATGQFQVPDTLSPLAGRPVPQTSVSSYSVQSIDSAATITAANSASILSASERGRPEFPNQSYAALHSQQHPAPYPPPTLKQRSSHPGQILTFTSAFASLHSSGSRTVGNSPAVTPGPGLYTPQPAQELPSEWESPGTPGTYASPFLHFTHRSQPKETHVADVDVDPISGRKMINHYEILDELGRGTHGKVKLGRDLSNNNFVAIKIVERFSKRRKLGKLGTTEDKVKKEVAILKQARHPNIVALLEVIDDPSRKKVYIVLEWVERGEIKWRTHGPREICMVEARRYEREKAGKNDPQSKVEDAAIFAEAQRRLTKEKRRQHRTFRRVRQDAADEVEIWSHEMAGDDVSDLSEDDKLSRVSSDSFGGKLLHENARRASRAPSPLPPQPEEVATPTTETAPQYLSLTSEPQTISPTTSRRDFGDLSFTGLEGTMYGAYVPSSYEDSRLPSESNSVHSLHSRPPSKSSSDNLLQTAAEVLDSDLNDDLDYVPVMTMQQIRVAFRDTVLGLQYLHFQGIIHRDIKPPNLLATLDHRVKISDFGVSYLGRPIHEGEVGEDVSEHEAQDLDDEAKELAKTVGTPAFYPPELCITDPIEDPPPITKAIDVWALGVTLFCMLFARTPYVDNEYVVMRRICDEEIYLPRKRVRPIDAKPRSRPSSHGRAFPPQAHGKRNELDFTYEELGDELHDLLKRLLIKDPRQRITLEEVRHHPWVLADLHEKVAWLEETDASRQSQGKKIEVSREDVNAAVVPLFLDRVKLGIKKVGERLGFGGGTSKSTGRGRTHSNADITTGGSVSPSNASTSTNISREERRRSLKGDDSTMAGFKTPREGEHPLSRSLAASPELDKKNAFFDETAARSDPALSGTESIEPISPSRLSLLERTKTAMATGGSMRTVRQADFNRSEHEESPPLSPTLPETPIALDSTGNLSSGWGGRLAQRVLKTVRERSTGRSVDGRASSSERGSVGSIDAHGEPSVALSQTTAAGLVHLLTTWDDIAPSSAQSSALNSPSVSRPLSLTSSPSGDRLSPSAAEPISLSRVSSSGSVSSVGRRAVLQYSHLGRSPVHAQSYIPPESSQEEWKRAEDEHIRKLVREQAEDADQAPPSPFDNRTCPPSPDDQHQARAGPRRVSLLDISNPESSHETSPIGQNIQFQPPMVSSTSDFGSAVSISMSNPSIPSVISEASSIDPRDSLPVEEQEKTDLMSSGETVYPKPQTQEEPTDEGYVADNQETAINSDDDDYDSSDSDGGLVMTRRKSAARTANAAAGDTITDMKDTGITSLSARSKKSSRSGSSNTMKKIRTRDSEDERRRPS